jgi:hypothetical protein
MRKIIFLLAFLACHAAQAATTPCAIRWDAWYGTLANDPDKNIQAGTVAAISAAGFTYRAPWFATPVSPLLLSVNGATQAVMDQEITYAKNAGLKCWAFDWYDVNDGGFDSSMMIAWHIYQTSSIKNNVNWTMNWQFSRIGNSASFAAAIPTYVSYFQQTNYQKVLTNRPVIFFFVDSPNALAANWGGSWANVKTAFDALRSATVTAGLGTPYIVLLLGNQTTAASDAVASGSDAISNYTPLMGSSGTWVTPWATAEAGIEGYWATQNAAATAASIGMVPIALTGWDIRPLVNTILNFYHGLAHSAQSVFVTAPTGSQVTSHLQAAVSYVNANAAVNPSGLILIYSWDELAEGGNSIMPQYNPANPASPNVTVLNAVAGVTW